MPTRSTEILDRSLEAFRAGSALSEGQYKLDGAVVRLGDGRVVVAGGPRLNVFDPITDAIDVVEGQAVPRRSFSSATVAGANVVLVTGGYDAAIIPTTAARLVRL